MKLFSEETWSKVNPKSKEALEDYSLELEAQGKSAKTIYQYQSDIKGFLCWVVNNKDNKYIINIKRKEYRNFFLLMGRDGTSSARINRFQSSIRNFLEYLVISDDYDVEINQMQHIKGLQKEAVRKIIFLSDSQINIILNYLVRHKEYQLATFVSLAYESGGRRNELAQVKKDSVIDGNQTNVVRGKRAKKFRLLYFKRTRQLAHLWLEQRGDDDIESLWITHVNGNREPASYSTLYGWVDKIREVLKIETGEDIKLNVHSFRHSCLNNFSDGTHHVLKEMGRKELPLEVLRLLAHHEDISTTQAYLEDRSDEMLGNAFGIKIE